MYWRGRASTMKAFCASENFDAFFALRSIRRHALSLCNSIRTQVATLQAESQQRHSADLRGIGPTSWFSNAFDFVLKPAMKI